MGGASWRPEKRSRQPAQPKGLTLTINNRPLPATTRKHSSSNCGQCDGPMRHRSSTTKPKAPSSKGNQGIEHRTGATISPPWSCASKRVRPGRSTTSGGSCDNRSARPAQSRQWLSIQRSHVASMREAIRGSWASGAKSIMCGSITGVRCTLTFGRRRCDHPRPIGTESAA